MPLTNLLPLNYNFSLLDSSVKMDMDPFNIFSPLPTSTKSSKTMREEKSCLLLAPGCSVSRVLQHAQLLHASSPSFSSGHVHQCIVTSTTQQPETTPCISLTTFCGRVFWRSTSFEQLSSANLRADFWQILPVEYYADFSAALNEIKYYALQQDLNLILASSFFSVLSQSYE